MYIMRRICSYRLSGISSKRCFSRDSVGKDNGGGVTSGSEIQVFETETNEKNGGVATQMASDDHSPRANSYFSRVASYMPTSLHRATDSTPRWTNTKKPNRIEVVQRTHKLVEELLDATDDSTILVRTQNLINHLLTFPLSRSAAVQVTRNNRKVIPFLLEKKDRETLRDVSLQCLTLCGHINPPKGPGIRILSIDGGGTRGVIALECLAAMERESGGKKIHEMFDMIVGVSTGALISTLLGAKELSIEEVQRTYATVSKQIFPFRYATKVGLMGRMLYTSNNSQTWKNVLREKIGEDTLLDSATDENIPKMAIVSCVINTNTNQPMPFLFRNYEHPASNSSHYRGSTKYKFWEALLASSAAPTYFDSVVLDDFIHRDGGVLINNPTAIALHEARQLWPNEEFQCVVSIGNGRILPEIEPEPLPAKMRKGGMGTDINAIIEAATETETIHHCISDLLPPTVYFRFNPYTSKKDGYPLDTIDPVLFEQMRMDGKLYVRRNREKIKAAALQLTDPSRRFRITSYTRRLLDKTMGNCKLIGWEKTNIHT